ncbi:MAG TPA: ABC-type transport auxiliary lipoprotein family protein [Nitrococcus sp.]|nr:ABC-type transport auxiliary lipoprotein family protein [Nitrococcus sp.]
MPRLALLAIAVLLTGCSALLPSPPPPAAHLYQLQLETPLTKISPTPAEARRGVVAVVQPQVAAGYATTAMAYRRGPWEINYYSQSRWVDDPARMLREALTNALDQLGPFRSALQAPSGITADYALYTEVLRLEQEFNHAPPSRERLTVRIKLIDLRHGVLLASRVLDLSTPTPTEDAHGGAVAANALLRQLAVGVVEFCRSALAG